MSRLPISRQAVRATILTNRDTGAPPAGAAAVPRLPESQRKAFLFENVVDSRGRKYDIPVLVGALAASRDIYALGMRCELADIENVWKRALADQIPPVEVKTGSCQGDRHPRATS